MKWTPQDVIALVLALSIPLYYLIVGLNRWQHPEMPVDPLVLETVNDLSKILLGGLLGWIAHERKH